mgnify:FL=1
MPLKFDYNPDTGVTQYFDYDPINDEINITSVQDCSAIVDYMTQLRNNEEYSKKGIKEEWWHYAKIPTFVEIELRKKVINIYDKNATKAILKEINQNYPALKATTKTHA